MAAASLALASTARAEFRFLGVWGTQGLYGGQFELPDGIAVDDGGTVWVVDRNGNRIERFSFNGRYEPFSPLDSRPYSRAPGRFRVPYGVATDPIGDIYVADTHNDRIQELSSSGRFIRAWGSHGKGDGQFDQPRDVALDPFGNVWVADHQNHRVEKFTAEGRFLGRFGAHGGDGSYGGGDGEFNSPRGLSSDAQGNIYVADDANHRIVKLDNDGRFLLKWGKDGGDGAFGRGDGEFDLPYGTAVDNAGHVWVTDTDNNRIQEFTEDGQFIAKYGAHGGDGTSGDGAGEFSSPYNLAVDCVGNLYVTDEGNFRVEKFGDPRRPKGVCPPRVVVGGPAGHLRRGSLSVPVACNELCAIAAAAVVHIAGRSSIVVRARQRIAGARSTIVLTLRGGPDAAGVLTGLAGRRVTVDLTVAASGAPGARRTVRRRLELAA